MVDDIYDFDRGTADNLPCDCRKQVNLKSGFVVEIEIHTDDGRQVLSHPE